MQDGGIYLRMEIGIKCVDNEMVYFTHTGFQSSILNL